MDYGKFKLSFSEAKRKIEEYDAMPEAEFEDLVRHWAAFDIGEGSFHAALTDIRESVLDKFKIVLSESGNKINYNLDLEIGLTLYEVLSFESGFTLINAGDDDIWRYFSVLVFPDLTFIRYPNRRSDREILKECIPGLTAVSANEEKDGYRIRKKRFYAHTRRIWVKTLWWYIYLGWQGSVEKTREVLKNNGTNVISHFIERPGRGYRPELFRSMLYAYSLLPEQKDKTFRAAGKLNLAKCVSMEPALTQGGEPEYARLLFEEVYVGDDNDDDQGNNPSELE